MTVPSEPKKIYSINDGNYTTWDPNMQRAIDGFRFNKPAYSARYVGSMVSDVHRTLLYGGIYLYPADAAKVSDDNASSFESLSLCVGSFAGKWKASHLV
jgi:fructose-1,6-bisphosphatase